MKTPRLPLPHLIIIGLLLLTSCGDTQYEYSSRTCYFVFDNSVHNDATLAAAMTPYSGVFTQVTLATHGGANYFVFQSNQGNSSEAIYNAIDSRRTQILGMNQGLIVGYGSLSDPLVFYAFDRECPNCFDPDAIPIRSHPLQMDTRGIATCSLCKRSYDLNNGGIITQGEAGNKLTRYRASTTGPYGVISVN